MTENQFANTLSFLLLETRGGANRARILLLLMGRPKNANSIARELGLNYGTVVAHLRALLHFGVVVPLGSSRYARGYSVSPDLTRHRDVFDRICGSLNGRP